MKLDLKGANYMPRRDGTGPAGMGEMTGRGFGQCNKENTETSFARGGKGCQNRKRKEFGKGCQNGRGFGCRENKE